MQLEKLLGKIVIENSTTEYKGRLDRENTIGWLKTVAGFANASGGTMYLGVEDKNHKLLGFDRTEADNERNYFNNQVNEHIIPRPPIKIEFLPYTIRDITKFILRIVVSTSSIRPVIAKFNGIPSIFMRRDGFTNGATYEEIREISLASSNAVYDTLYSDKQYNADNFKELQEYYAQHNNEKKLSCKALSSLGFMNENNFLSNGAILFSDNYDGLKTAMTCSVFSGINRGSERIVAVNRFKGNIIRAIKYACEFIEQRMNHGMIKVADRHIEQPAYPPRAILEGVINAIAHRDYFLDGTQIQIDMFRDRLEISSPGSFYQGAPIEKTYNLSSIISKRRNELICGILVMCKVMEAAGTGFDKIIEEYSMADIKHKPYIYSASDHFTLVLPDLTYSEGVALAGETIEYVPIENETKYDKSVLAFCYFEAHDVAEIASHLQISNSSYLRKKVLENLALQKFLIVDKISRKKIYRTNPEMVRMS